MNLKRLLILRRRNKLKLAISLCDAGEIMINKIVKCETFEKNVNIVLKKKNVKVLKKKLNTQQNLNTIQ
jgi:hypothetical protein